MVLAFVTVGKTIFPPLLKIASTQSFAACHPFAPLLELIRACNVATSVAFAAVVAVAVIIADLATKEPRHKQTLCDRHSGSPLEDVTTYSRNLPENLFCPAAFSQPGIPTQYNSPDGLQGIRRISPSTNGLQINTMHPIGPLQPTQSP